jgi:hypothetical protein
MGGNWGRKVARGSRAGRKDAGAGEIALWTRPFLLVGGLCCFLHKSGPGACESPDLTSLFQLLRSEKCGNQKTWRLFLLF